MIIQYRAIRYEAASLYTSVPCSFIYLFIQHVSNVSSLHEYQISDSFLDCGRFRRKLFFSREERNRNSGAHLFVSTLVARPSHHPFFFSGRRLKSPLCREFCTKVEKRESFFPRTVVKVFSRDLSLCSYVSRYYSAPRWFIYKRWWSPPPTMYQYLWNFVCV